MNEDRERKDSEFLQKKWPLKKLIKMNNEARALIGKRAKVTLISSEAEDESLRTISGEVNSVADFMIFWGTCDRSGTSFYQIEKIEG
jgi:hypothetical protein